MDSSPPALLRDERVAWVIAALFTLVGVEAVLTGRYLHDEGILSWYFASLIGHEPIAGLFFQKLRPTLALFYAPIAPLGLQPFLLFHLLVSASGILLIASLARKFGHRTPNVAALVFACSPLLLATAPGGHSNADAVTGLVFAAWLLFVRERPLAAGAMLAATVFIRSEAAPFVLVIAAERLWTARPSGLRVVAGVLLVPTIYGLAGAVYHHDLLWLVHYPPALTRPPPDAHWLREDPLSSRLGQSAAVLLTLSPALLLALVMRWPSSSAERAQAIALVLYLAAIRGFPMLGLFNFDGSPRYVACGLPALALLVSRAVDDSFDERPGGPLGLFALASFAGLVIGASGAGWVSGTGQASGTIVQDAVFACIVVAALALALVRAGRPRAALAIWVVPLILSLPIWQRSTGVARPRASLDRLTEVLGPELQSQGEITIVTNYPLVGPWLEFVGLLAPDQRAVHFIIQHDTQYELDQLLDAEVGQRETILGYLDRDFYGLPITAEQRLPEAWPPGTIVVFRADDNLPDTLDLERWNAAMTVFAEGDKLTFGRLHEARP